MNKFIEKIGFVKHDFRCFKQNDMFDFKPGINLIVGDQGCGKSSLFYSILNYEKSGIAMKYNPEYGYRFIDTELMNPRLDSSFKAHKEFDTVTEYQQAEIDAVKTRLVYGLKEKSHGEVILPLILSSNEKDVTYFIDEPEAGLSLKSQYKILKHFKEISKHSQLIIATHSLVLINSVDEVLSLEHKKWMSSKEFIKTQK